MIASASRLARPRVSPSAERAFFSAMAVAMAAVVFIGFARTFFLRAWFPEVRALAAPEPFFLVHGFFFAAWMVLLVVQTQLIRRRAVELHRSLGIIGALVAVLMVVLGIWGSLIAAARPGGFIGVPEPPLVFLIVPLGDITLFAALVGAGIVYRSRPQAHKRLMIIGTLSLLPAAIARIPLEAIAIAGPAAFFGGVVAFLAALVVWDLISLKRLHPATLFAGLAFLLSVPLRMTIAGTDAWQRTAGAIVGWMS